MTLSIETISYIDDLKSLIEENDIQTIDFCLVGSAALAVRGIRANSDLDICFSKNVGELSNVELPSKIELAPNKYEHLGISDAELVFNPNYHDVVDGYKIVRPEIEYSHKKARQWDKDIEDIERYERYREETNNWRDSLERHDHTPEIAHLLRRGVRSLRQKGVLQTIKYAIQYARWHGQLPAKNRYSGQPTTILGKAFRSIRQDGLQTTLARGVRLIKLKEPTGLLDRYSRLRHKAKLGTLAERQLELRYPTARLLTQQYDGSDFTRYDLVVRLIAAKALLAGERFPPLVAAFESKSGLDLREELTPHVKRYNASGIPPTVPVGYDSTIIDANVLAVALLDDQESVPVSVTSTEDDPAYDISWFNSSSFSDNDYNQLDDEFSNLLYESNALFAMILWPPAQKHFDAIVDQLRSEKEIHFVEDIRLADEEFEEFVWALYESQQDLDLNHINTKIESMAAYEKRVRVIGVEVSDPRIREGFANEMIQTKERVRERFTPKILRNNPSANLIIHPTDNYNHNKETWEIIEAYSSKPILPQRVSRSFHDIHKNKNA